VEQTLFDFTCHGGSIRGPIVASWHLLIPAAENRQAAVLSAAVVVGVRFVHLNLGRQGKDHMSTKRMRRTSCLNKDQIIKDQI
jgi:hypothetical protein